MNFVIVRYLIGWMLGIESIFLLLPALTAVIYGEPELPAYLIAAAISLAGAALLGETLEEGVDAARDAEHRPGALLGQLGRLEVLDVLEPGDQAVERGERPPDEERVGQDHHDEPGA